jgi:signal transduction histidine kinase
MRRPLSVGARWTLRYSFALLLTVSLLAVIVGDRVERRIEQDARLLVVNQLKEIRKGLRKMPEATREAFLANKISVGEPMVGLGIALHDRDGRLVRALGSLDGVVLPVPEALRSGEDNDLFYEAELGRSYPFFVAAEELGEDGYIQVAIYGRSFVRRAEHIATVFQWAIPALLLLTGGLGLWLARSSLRPIADMTRTARHISAAHLEEAVPSRGTGDELDQLADTLNDMLGRIRAGMERTRRFSADVSREFRTPLLALRRRVQGMLGREGLSEWHRRELRAALEETDALSESVHAMLRVAWSDDASDPGRRVELPLGPLLANVAGSCSGEAGEHGVEIRCAPFPDCVVAGDPFRLHQVFASLLQAAVRATPGGGVVELSGEEGVDTVRVTIRRSDPKEDPLGGPIHSVAREILRSLGGSLEVEEGSGTHATVTVTLPRPVS